MDRCNPSPLQRDWWNGYPTEGNRGIAQREENKLNDDAVYGSVPERSSCDIVNVELVDLKPLPGQKPAHISLSYEIMTKFLGPTASPSIAPMSSR